MDESTKPYQKPADFIKPPVFGTAADNYRMLRNYRNEVIVTKNLPVDVVFTGDSITHLWELQGYFRHLGYIVNSGISGDVSYVLEQRLQADVVQLKPKVCVVLIGINDTECLNNPENAKTHEDVYRVFIDSYTSILEQLKAAGIRPIVCAILPISGKIATNGRNALVVRMNEALQVLCRQYVIPYVDYHAVMVSDSGELLQDVSWDGLHPHVIGYDRMAEVLMPVLEQELKGSAEND